MNVRGGNHVQRRGRASEATEQEEHFKQKDREQDLVSTITINTLGKRRKRGS